MDVQLRSGCTGQEYLSKLEAALTQAFDRFEPQMVIHNAGSDILDKDPLGRCDLKHSMLCHTQLPRRPCVLFAYVMHDQGAFI